VPLKMFTEAFSERLFGQPDWSETHVLQSGGLPSLRISSPAAGGEGVGNNLLPGRPFSPESSPNEVTYYS
jgi:hypothetical protein